jgi:uncharacterized protein
LTKKLIIIMANTDPRNGEELGAPIFQASVAAAMSYDVEVICTATAAKLMRTGVAANLKVKAGDARTIYDFIKDAHAAGVKFFCCAPGMDITAMHKEDLIPECHGVVGAAHFIEEIMTGESKVLTY